MQADTPIVNIVHYKPSVSCKTTIETARTVAQEDADKMNVDWRDIIELPEKLQKFRESMLEILPEFSTMWDDHLEDDMRKSTAWS